jgi:hypothetical protein
MPIFQVIAVFVIALLLVWAVDSFIPGPAWLKKLFNIAIGAILVIWLLQITGIIGYLDTVRTPRLR